jgi:putative nucleotidyltransferase with HDIG domain
MTGTVNLEELRQRLRKLDAVPMVSTILRPLLAQLNRPPEEVRIESLVGLVAVENSLAAKCLQLANSPLFGRTKPVSTIRGAVLALGIQRLQAILLSACMVNVLRGAAGMDATVLWEHSLACALVSQQFARCIRHSDPEKVYLTGLLHDIGLILGMVTYPDAIRNAFAASRAQSMTLEAAERATFGLTHCEFGAIVAEEWRLPVEVAEVARFHHASSFAEYRHYVAIVHLCDRLCQLGGLGYGYSLMEEADLAQDPAWPPLLQRHPSLRQLDLARFTFELESYFAEVKRMVAVLFRV